MEMSSVSALVTGASGFIGARLVQRLTHEGCVVRALVRDIRKAESLRRFRVAVAEADLRDTVSLRKIVSNCDIVFHCAAITTEMGDRRIFYQTNVLGTKNMIEASLASGVSRFVHLSSVAVYGFDPPETVDETQSFAYTGNPYADSKIDAEKEVWHVSRRGMAVVILRPTNVYGPGSYTWTVRPVELLRSGRLFLVDGGNGICNHLYIDNLLDAIILAAQSRDAIGEAYQVTDGHPITWKEFFGYYAEMAGRKGIPSIPARLASVIGWAAEKASLVSGKPPRITREAIRFLKRRSRFSIEKARRELRFEPRVSLTEGMVKTGQWLRENGYLAQVP